jgi:hypothetical protein
LAIQIGYTSGAFSDHRLERDMERPLPTARIRRLPTLS